jgi:hypothetical protein
MRTVKWNPFLSGVCTFLGGMLLWTGAVRADVTSTSAAAIVVFPKILVDVTAFRRLDTVIQLTNTAAHPVNVRCFYVNANGFCSNDESLICDPEDPQGSGHVAVSCESQFAACIPDWQETDFSFRLTSKQPIVWTAFEGMPVLPLDPGTGVETGEVNIGSIPPSPANPMRGELKCIEVDDAEAPNDKNDLKGEATIERFTTDTPTLDIRGYNGIGIQAIAGANNGDDTLILGPANGDPPGEYNACPNILVLDHFFDDAREPALGDVVRTHLTLVPCSENFNQQAPITTTVQFLVYNEFEQRFSTSRPVTCFSEITLSDIDTKLGATGDAQSIFNVNVQGTLTGQTLVRGVADSDTTHGHGLLAILEEFHCVPTVDENSVQAECGTSGNTARQYSAAFMTDQRGTRLQQDYIYLPMAAPAGP